MNKVGISLREMTVEGKSKEFINQTYINYLNKYKVIPIFISNTTNKIDDLIDLCDGFILCGGTDIDPKHYNEENTSSDVCIHDDLLDQKIIEYATKKNKPLLGICRGMQSINVFLGGSLFQNVDNHYDKLHDVSIDKSSNLGLKMQRLITTNSYHHQVIKKLADCLRVVGISDDNVYEIIEHKSKPIIGVQYHPELLLNDKHSKDLFEYFMLLLQTKSYLDEKNNNIYPF